MSNVEVNIEQTANDALSCKLSCIKLKYYEDRFLPVLYGNKSVTPFLFLFISPSAKMT